MDLLLCGHRAIAICARTVCTVWDRKVICVCITNLIWITWYKAHADVPEEEEVKLS